MTHLPRIVDNVAAVTGTKIQVKKRSSPRDFKRRAVLALQEKGCSIDEIATYLLMHKNEVVDLIDGPYRPSWKDSTIEFKKHLIATRVVEGQSLRSISSAFRGATESAIIGFANRNLKIEVTQ